MGTEDKQISVIITGASGMVGEGVLLTCLDHPAVSRVLMVNRRHVDREHPKLREIVVPDFLDLSAVEAELRGYDACFYCAGISSRGMSEADYSRVTYDTPLHFARTLAKLDPALALCHVSGASTDGTEKGRIMWARVKGRAENAVLQVGLRAAYNFRPGFMRPIPGQRNIKSYYGLINWLGPVLLTFFPRIACTMEEVGLAMINAVRIGYEKPVLEVTDIRTLAAR